MIQIKKIKTQTNNKVVLVGCCTAKHSMVLNFLQTDSRRTATGVLGLLNLCTLYPISSNAFDMGCPKQSPTSADQRDSSCQPPKASTVQELSKNDLSNPY